MLHTFSALLKATDNAQQETCEKNCKNALLLPKLSASKIMKKVLESPFYANGEILAENLVAKQKFGTMEELVFGVVYNDFSLNMYQKIIMVLTPCFHFLFLW